MNTLAEILLLFFLILLIGGLYMRLLDRAGRNKQKVSILGIKEVFLSSTGKMRVLYRLDQDQRVSISIQGGAPVFHDVLSQNLDQIDVVVAAPEAKTVEVVFETKGQKITRKVEVVQL